MARTVLIAGISTRAAADSAARAGFEVTAIDAFGDLDGNPAVRSLSLRRDFGMRYTAQTVTGAARGLSGDAVVYLASFENHPGAVNALSSGRALWGNPPDVLRRVRDPRVLLDAFRSHGIPAPGVIVNPLDSPAGVDDPDRWLVKPRGSGGGHHVSAWRPEQRVRSGDAAGVYIPDGCYLQERLEGVPGSVVFAAAHRRAVALGVSRQLIGEGAFGAGGYRYCGNIFAAAGDTQFGDDEAVVAAATELAAVVAAEFGLVGLNGIDFIAANGVASPIEVNPRWCGSMELVERAFDLPLFHIHAAACDSGVLPAFDLARTRGAMTAVGKAIVFARDEVTMGDTRSWLADATVRDVPHPGERIAAGHPICTVFAQGTNAESCHAALVQRAERVYAEVYAGHAAYDARRS